MPEDDENSETNKYLKAIMLLQLRSAIEDDDKRPKLEVVLSNAGFSQGEIAKFLGKTQPAVSQIIKNATKRK